jgi:hypothetical protein
LAFNIASTGWKPVSRPSRFGARMPDDEPQPLDYRNPRDDRPATPNIVGRIASCIVGLMLGVVMLEPLPKKSTPP